MRFSIYGSCRFSGSRCKTSALVAVGIDYCAYPTAFLALDRKTAFRFAGLLLGGIWWISVKCGNTSVLKKLLYMIFVSSFIKSQFSFWWEWRCLLQLRQKVSNTICRQMLSGMTGEQEWAVDLWSVMGTSMPVLFICSIVIPNDINQEWAMARWNAPHIAGRRLLLCVTNIADRGMCH